MAETQHPPEEYDDALAAMLQLIWGEGFLSPGGPEAAGAIVAGLDLRDKTVLDIADQHRARHMPNVTGCGNRFMS